MEYERHLAENLYDIHRELTNLTYMHGKYEHFVIRDSKRREIHEASTRDKLVHQVIYDYLVKIYEPVFIKDSYSSRVGKGSHKALKTFRYFARLASIGGGCIYVLKCDIRKYFDNVDHNILFELISERIKDAKTLNVIKEIITSFDAGDIVGRGIPLGNVTSQVFANIYLNELDHYVKAILKERFYVRYNDDFVIVDNDRARLEVDLRMIQKFVRDTLLLDIPANKASIRKLSWGVDFLGYNILPNCMLLRDKTKVKLYNNLNESNIESYLGLLKHCDSHNLKQKVMSKLNNYWSMFDD